jgi:HK97 gp10 family phage protein
MARSDAAIAGYVQGLREAKAAFQALPEIAREAMLDAVMVTSSELAREAKAKILQSPSVQTRSLYNAIGWSVTKTNGRGRVGVTAGSSAAVFPSTTGAPRRRRIKGVIVGNRLVRPDQYARYVEFGTSHMASEAFMIPAAESQKAPFLDRAIRAGKVIEQNVAAVGGRYV